MIKLGDKIKELRQNLGWNQEELAEGICTRSYISVLENNLMTPSDDVITKLSKKLGFDLRSIQDSYHPSSPYKEDLNRIESLLYHQDYARALHALNEIPTDAELPPEEKAKWLWERATLISLDQQKWDEGLTWSKEALELLRGSLDHSLIAKIYHLMGVFEYHKGMIEDAYQSCLKGIQEMSKSDSPATRFLISLYVNLALIHNLWDEPHSALIYLKQAKDLNKRAKAFYHAGDIEFQWGYASKQLGNLSQAKKNYLLAEEFYSMGEDTDVLGALYTNLGIMDRELGYVNDSLTYLQRAMEYYHKTSFKDKLNNSRYEFALTLTKLQIWEEALQISLELIETISNESHLLPKSYLLMGEVYTELNKIELAEPYLLDAYDLAEKNIDTPLQTKQSILKSLIQFYERISEMERKKYYLEKLLNLIG